MASSTTRYEKERSGLNHWTGVTQGTWNKSCGYYGKWTSFLPFRVRMLRIRGRTLRDESLETNTARDLEQVVRMFVEMDVGPVSPSSTTQDVRQKSQPLRRTLRTEPHQLPLAFPAHLHYHRTNKKKEFFVCTRIVFAAIISVFIPEWP